MKKHLTTSVLMTIATTVLLGMIYPAVVTVAAQLFFPDKANGQLIEKDGKLIGSRIIGQPFVGDKYFHSRPSAAGAVGYDAGASGGSNLGPTNQKLVDRIQQSTEQDKVVPIDLVTTSASGLDPHISPAAARFQAQRVAKARGLEVSEVESLIIRHLEKRQLGVLGEPRVNVLNLNLDLDRASLRR
jgi:potassium-transporting ATPase KdpC subunit